MGASITEDGRQKDALTHCWLTPCLKSAIVHVGLIWANMSAPSHYLLISYCYLKMSDYYQHLLDNCPIHIEKTFQLAKVVRCWISPRKNTDSHSTNQPINQSINQAQSISFMQPVSQSISQLVPLLLPLDEVHWTNSLSEVPRYIVSVSYRGACI